MRLTTRGRYAVTALLDLALHGGGPVPLADMAVRQGISAAYLEQLLARVRRRGLVAGVRGPGGGYRLAVPAAALSVAAILDAVDDATDATSCGGAGDCQDGALCLTHGLWEDLSVRIRGFLDGITLADLTGRMEVRAVCWRQDAAAASASARGPLQTPASGRSSEP